MRCVRNCKKDNKNMKKGDGVRSRLFLYSESLSGVVFLPQKFEKKSGRNRRESEDVSFFLIYTYVENKQVMNIYSI